MRDLLIIILLIAVFGIGVILWPLGIILGLALLFYIKRKTPEWSLSVKTAFLRKLSKGLYKFAKILDSSTGRFIVVVLLVIAFAKGTVLLLHLI